MAKANMSLKRNPMPSQEPAVRAHNFDEVALGYSEEKGDFTWGTQLSLAHKLGMDFAICRGSNAADTITFSAGLGKEYIWVQSTASDFDTFCRHANHQAELAAQYGLKVGIHNHLGTPVETEEQLEEFLARCPNCYIVFDIGHHHAAGGDPLYIIEKYLLLFIDIVAGIKIFNSDFIFLLNIQFSLNLILSTSFVTSSLS